MDQYTAAVRAAAEFIRNNSERGERQRGYNGEAFRHLRTLVELSPVAAEDAADEGQET